MVGGSLTADTPSVQTPLLRLAVSIPVLCVALFGARVANASPGLPPVAADSAPVDTTRHPGVADTVTMLPPVRVDSDRPKAPDRESATTVRLERSRLVRFQPSTTADALL